MEGDGAGELYLNGKEKDLTISQVLERDIVEMNLRNLSNLKECIDKEETAWIFGTGVSVVAGMPLWGSLLQKMWMLLVPKSFHSEAVDKDDPFFSARKSIEEGLNPEDLGFKNGKAKSIEVFRDVNLLEAAEYMDYYIRLFSDQGSPNARRPETRHVVLKELLRKILKASFRPLVGEEKGKVITYNYDDVLEFCLEEVSEGNTEQIAVIAEQDDNINKPEREHPIRIYHPHGAINVTGSRLGVDSAKVVLTEGSYYSLEQVKYSWQNSVQAKALTDSHCIFVGFSGEDYNFRRIIKNVGPSKTPDMHYIFVAVNDLIKSIYGQARDENTGALCMDRILEGGQYALERLYCLEKLHMQYTYWTHYGITPIFTSYRELPEMIGMVLSKSISGDAA